MFGIFFFQLTCLQLILLSPPCCCLFPLSEMAPACFLVTVFVILWDSLVLHEQVAGEEDVSSDCKIPHHHHSASESHLLSEVKQCLLIPHCPVQSSIGKTSREVKGEVVPSALKLPLSAVRDFARAPGVC